MPLFSSFLNQLLAGYFYAPVIVKNCGANDLCGEYWYGAEGDVNIHLAEEPLYEPASLLEIDWTQLFQCVREVLRHGVAYLTEAERSLSISN
jgi:hypothetical protein